jgi:hypothetical protein
LLYPCLTLATQIDPLYLGVQLSQPDRLPERQQLVEAVTDHVQTLLKPILEEYRRIQGRTDERWYWAALALLDKRHYAHRISNWLNSDDSDLMICFKS